MTVVETSLATHQSSGFRPSHQILQMFRIIVSQAVTTTVAGQHCAIDSGEPNPNPSVLSFPKRLMHIHSALCMDPRYLRFAWWINKAELLDQCSVFNRTRSPFRHDDHEEIWMSSLNTCPVLLTLPLSPAHLTPFITPHFSGV